MEFDNIFLIMGIIFCLAACNKYFAAKINMPEVTGYVLIGVIFGGSILKILSFEIVDKLSPVSTLALGIIAFTIGIELKLSTIKKLGKSIFMIVIFECVGTFVVVLLILLYIAKLQIHNAILLGAVASATAPAATVAVIKQYKSKGSLTTSIMAVVGIDDAVALIIFVIASSFASSFLLGKHIMISTIILKAVYSISLSIILGIIFAVAYARIFKNIRSDDMVKISISACIILLLGLSEMSHISELLSIMTFGAVLTNISPVVTKKSERVTGFLSPIFLSAFFIIGGAHLDISVVSSIGVVGLIYFVARSIGKVGGASIGAILGNASEKVKKYIGFTLLPQVGVALALALAISKEYNKPKFGDAGKDTALMIINILLFTTIITEIVGPVLTKFVLTKSGEIQSK